jgi:predicted amidophosphoribosyltransferase
MMPALFADQLRKADKEGTGSPALTCPECKNPISEESRFCPSCGHQIVVFDQCPECGKNLPPKAKFCPGCGRPVAEKKANPLCFRCGSENLPHSVYCNQCGEKLNP